MTQTFKTLRQVALVASLLLLPGLAFAQSRPVTAGGGFASLGARVGGWDYGALLALEIPPSGLDVGPKISGELNYGVLDLAENLRLKVGGRAGFAYHGSNAWYIDIIPHAQLVYGINEQFAVHGAFGLGPAILKGAGDTTVKLEVAFGGGVAYALSPAMNLLGEIRIAIIDGNTFIAVPTIGIQWH